MVRLTLIWFIFVTFSSPIYCQNRDSLLLDLYKSGKISRDIYYESRSLSEVIKEGIQVIQKLRSQLTYKFTLDFIIENSDTNNIRKWAEGAGHVKLLHSSDPQVLEEFSLFSDYKLYQYRSFNNKSIYYLLGAYSPNFHRFDLFFVDSNNVRHCDSIDLPREGRFEFDTLNGGSVIKYYYPTWGTGYFRNHFIIGSIMNNKFHLLYETVLAEEAGYPWSPFPIRTLTTVRFTDINKDGYMDISEESSVDSLAELSENGFEGDSIKSLQSKKLIETSSKNFLWDNTITTFIEQKSK